MISEERFFEIHSTTVF